VDIFEKKQVHDEQQKKKKKKGEKKHPREKTRIAVPSNGPQDKYLYLVTRQ
jgi:hypothetical protein